VSLRSDSSYSLGDGDSVMLSPLSFFISENVLSLHITNIHEARWGY